MWVKLKRGKESEDGQFGGPVRILTGKGAGLLGMQRVTSKTNTKLIKIAS